MLGWVSQGDDIVYSGDDFAACVELALGVAAADCRYASEDFWIGGEELIGPDAHKRAFLHETTGVSTRECIRRKSRSYEGLHTVSVGSFF